MGTPVFAVASLEILHKNGYEICAVVTVPDKKKGRGLHLSFSDVKKYALENNLYLLQPESLNDTSFEKEIISIRPDLIVVVAFRILPKRIFTIPKFGSINLHASLLPKYRGAAPINRAIMNGEKETGVTTFFLKEKVDTGNIILQKKINIDDSDDAGSMHDKLSLLGAEAVLETVKLIGNDEVDLKIQDEKLTTSAPKIFKEDCNINWNTTAAEVNNFIRGLSPYPCAFTCLNGKTIKIYKALIPSEVFSTAPGKIIILEKKLYAGTNDNVIEILELQLEGKKKISASEFINSLNKSVEYQFKKCD